MEIDKTQATALAAWARFDAGVSDPLLRAVSAAYALVVCSDGVLADSEVQAYVQLAQADDALEDLDASLLEHAIGSLVEAMQTDVVRGRAKALEIVAAECEDADHVAVVLRAAKIALRADSRVSRDERAALTTVCEALGVKARDHVPEA